MARQPAKRLTPQQKRFAHEYVVDLNATKAAIRAGYSEHSAARLGHELVNNHLVTAEIERQQQRIADRTDVTVDDIVARLAAIAFADIIDYVRVETGPVQVPTPHGGTVERIVQTTHLVDTVKLTRKQRMAIAELKTEFNKFGDRVNSIKLYDATKALELLGRHLGMWNDKLDVRVQGTVEELLEKMRGRVSEQSYAEVVRFLAEAAGLEGVVAETAAGDLESPEVH